MCTVLLPPGVNPIAVKKKISSYIHVLVFGLDFAVLFHCASVSIATMQLFARPNNQGSILDKNKA
jgi:hypothetical protein